MRIDLLQAVDMNMFVRQTIVTNMKKKHYSFLDHRRNTFDNDFEQFCKSTTELNASFTLNTDELFLWRKKNLMVVTSVLFICIILPFLLQYQLKNFMETTLGKIQNTESALMVLKQFERWVTSVGWKVP